MSIERLKLQYSIHPFVTAPADKHAKIWRYMNIKKFVSLIETGSLFFCRADKLQDTWEGAQTLNNLRLPSFLAGYSETDAPVISAMASDFNRSLQRHTFLNCWHLNQGESAAMWQLYVPDGNGIAIQSTFSRLTGSFTGDENEMFQVYVGKITYLNYEEDMFTEGNTFIPFMHKRLAFEHERELRAIVQAVTPGDTPVTDMEAFAEGLLVEINLHKLIENVYAAPASEESVAESVQKAMEKLRLKTELKRSELSQAPFF